MPIYMQVYEQNKLTGTFVNEIRQNFLWISRLCDRINVINCRQLWVMDTENLGFSPIWDYRRYLKKLWVGLDEIFWTGSDWDIKPLEHSGQCTPDLNQDNRITVLGCFFIVGDVRSTKCLSVVGFKFVFIQYHHCYASTSQIYLVQDLQHICMHTQLSRRQHDLVMKVSDDAVVATSSGNA